MVDKNGLPLFNEGLPVSISLEGGAIEKQYSWEGLEGGQNDYWQVRGDDNATALFEFMSEHITGSETMVEMGLTRTGTEGNAGLNFISTGHKSGAEPAMSHLYGGQLQFGYSIREMTHSHPIGNKIGTDDFGLKLQIIGLQLENNNTIPKFSIFFNPKKQYIYY